MSQPAPAHSLETLNFGFLARYDPLLVQVAALVERYFPDDPVTALMKLRQFGELLAQQAAARAGVSASSDEPQAERLGRLRREAGYPREVLDLFHDLRRFGNEAAHQHRGDHAAALTGLKVARQLAIWFHRTFEDRAFRPGPFQPPRPPPGPTAPLRDELEWLRAERNASLSEAEMARRAAQAAEAARLSAEEQARVEGEERAVWEALATETEADKARIAAELAALQATAQAAPAAVQEEVREAAERAATGIDLDEAATREIVDARLRARGWEADTRHLRHGAGTRPARGRHLAIAEWPSANGPADYALFIGTTCVGVIEAKRKRRNVAAAIDQAGGYAQGFQTEPGIDLPPGGPWPAESGPTAQPPYRVPFLFAANGRSYLKQVETQSGIWFRDARDPANHRRARSDWPTPDDLRAMLGTDRAKAQADLAALPMDFGLPLLPYQRRAIEAVEKALASDARRSMLLAMATGTGKTRLAIAMLYRLLATRRFRRVCFVVDRTALGEQAAGEFRSARIVGPHAFADIFGLKGLGDITPDTATKVHICTIQSLVQRVLFANALEDAPPVDRYDLIVVDECHRGYLLDREMSDTELSFRSKADYVSKYRRVLEHFDAVKIGLTATPALHTTDIFGPPVFTYTYREAVVDGWPIDHEPPLRIETALSRQGIHFRRGEALPLLHPRAGETDLATAPDALDFEVDDFNRGVAGELARHIDPGLPGKTLVFAATDAHADMVVDELLADFAARYGAIDDAAVRKITGSIREPGKVIRQFRNDAQPKIAVTVDLLTTGVDVPPITNLVFLRRVLTHPQNDGRFRFRPFGSCGSAATTGTDHSGPAGTREAPGAEGVEGQGGRGVQHLPARELQQPDPGQPGRDPWPAQHDPGVVGVPEAFHPRPEGAPPGHLQRPQPREPGRHQGQGGGAPSGPEDRMAGRRRRPVDEAEHSRAFGAGGKGRHVAAMMQHDAAGQPVGVQGVHAGDLGQAFRCAREEAGIPAPGGDAHTQPVGQAVLDIGDRQFHVLLRHEDLGGSGCACASIADRAPARTAEPAGSGDVFAAAADAGGRGWRSGTRAGWRRGCCSLPARRCCDPGWRNGRARWRRPRSSRG